MMSALEVGKLQQQKTSALEMRRKVLDMQQKTTALTEVGKLLRRWVK